jgi:N-terminal domain in fatty acid synthase subunit beta
MDEDRETIATCGWFFAYHRLMMLMWQYIYIGIKRTKLRLVVLKDEFTHNQPQRDTVATTAQLENEAEGTIEPFASFLAYVAESIAEDQSTHARTALLLSVFKHFTSTYLATKDIHFLTSTFDTDTRKTVLSASFLAVGTPTPRQQDKPTSPGYLPASRFTPQWAEDFRCHWSSQGLIRSDHELEESWLDQSPELDTVLSAKTSYSLEFHTTASTWTE